MTLKSGLLVIQDSQLTSSDGRGNLRAIRSAVLDKTEAAHLLPVRGCRQRPRDKSPAERARVAPGEAVLARCRVCRRGRPVVRVDRTLVGTGDAVGRCSA